MSENTRDCKHGRLARSCEICFLERENADLQSDITRHVQIAADLATELANERSKIIHCVSCGDSWYDSGFTESCPICALGAERKAREELERKLVDSYDAYAAMRSRWERRDEYAFKKEQRAEAAEQRCKEYLENGERLKAAADSWKQEAERLRGVEAALRFAEQRLKQVRNETIEECAGDREMTECCQRCAHNAQLLLQARAHNETTYRLYVTYYRQSVAQAKGIRRLHKIIARLRKELK